MIYEPDIANVAPALVLALDDGLISLRCIGILDARTRRQFLEAVEALLAGGPNKVTIDIEDLDITDDEGAHALAYVEEMLREANVGLHWRRSRPNSGTPFLVAGQRTLPRNRTLPPATWLPSPDSWRMPPGA